MVWLTVLLATALPTLAYWQYWRWTHRRMLQLSASLPGPPALPIIGNGLSLISFTNDHRSTIANILNKYGQYVRLWLGPDLNICVKNPTDVRLLLTSNKMNQKGPLYDLMKLFIGSGLLSGGPTWRSHRKIATPSYNKKAVQHYSAVFNEEALQLLKCFSNRDAKEVYNVYRDVVRCTTQCVCQTLLGLSKQDSMSLKKLDEVVTFTPSMYDLIFRKMAFWWLQIPFVSWLLGEDKIEKYFLATLNEMTSDIVHKKKTALKNLNTQSHNQPTGIIEQYLLSGELNEQELKWECFSVFTTSQEASAKVTSALFLFLAHLPEWQEKVYHEIIEVFGPDDCDVTAEQLKKLHHLDMVYKEVLRIFSIAALIQRTVEEDITIKGGDITLPSGTSVLIPIHEIHRDPQYWDEPDKVKPERFLPENMQNRDPNAFIPFSLGSMDCLGRVFGTALVKTLVVRVLRHVELVGVGSLDDLRLHVAISVESAGGYYVRVRPRSPLKQ